MMENPKYVAESGEIKAQAIATHNLIRLANECLVSLSEEEEKTLASITQQVVWAKYPAPKKWTEMPSNLNPDDRNNAHYALQNPFYNRRVQNTVNANYSKAAIRFALLKEEWRANQGKDR